MPQPLAVATAPNSGTILRLLPFSNLSRDMFIGFTPEDAALWSVAVAVTVLWT